MKKNLLILVGTLLILLTLPYTTFGGKPSAKVLIVHSYSKDHVCGAPQAEGVIRALADRGWNIGQNLDVQSVYMETKKNYTSPEQIKARGELALSTVASFEPDVVVVLDDNAIREVMLPLVGRHNLSVVFSGMNGQPVAYHDQAPFIHTLEHPGSNITGVYEKLHVAKSLAVLHAALSDRSSGSTVVGITDYSPTGNAITKQFELELTTNDGPLKWELRRVKDFSAYQALVLELNDNPDVAAIYPAALSLATEGGDVYSAAEIFDWTIAHSTKPEMALNYYFSKIGLFGGAAVDFTAMGYAAGEKVAMILGGRQAGELPIEDAASYAIVFNLKRAATLGIRIPEPLLTAADHIYR
jgi:ABC-type uncharacterized transport system substrate-binding protein